MSPPRLPVFEDVWRARLRRELHDAEHQAQKLIHHGQPYDEPEPASPTAPTATTETLMSILTEFHNVTSEAVDNIEGWLGNVKAKLPEVQALVAKYAASPIVSEIEALGDTVLPPGVESAIVDLIKTGGAAAKAAAAALETPAAPVAPAAPAAPAAPEQPAEAAPAAS